MRAPQRPVAEQRDVMTGLREVLYIFEPKTHSLLCNWVSSLVCTNAIPISSAVCSTKQAAGPSTFVVIQV